MLAVLYQVGRLVVVGVLDRGGVGVWDDHQVVVRDRTKFFARLKIIIVLLVNIIFIVSVIIINHDVCHDHICHRGPVVGRR